LQVQHRPLSHAFLPVADASSGSRKVIQFKIEILRAAPPTRYQTGVNLSLTRGAQSAFKGGWQASDPSARSVELAFLITGSPHAAAEVYGRLKQDYRLDTPKTFTPSSVRI
jgi:hypothetical protein